MVIGGLYQLNGTQAVDKAFCKAKYHKPRIHIWQKLRVTLLVNFYYTDLKKWFFWYTSIQIMILATLFEQLGSYKPHELYKLWMVSWFKVDTLQLIDMYH